MFSIAAHLTKDQQRIDTNFYFLYYFFNWDVLNLLMKSIKTQLNIVFRQIYNNYDMLGDFGKFLLTIMLV